MSEHAEWSFLKNCGGDCELRCGRRTVLTACSYENVAWIDMSPQDKASLLAMLNAHELLLEACEAAKHVYEQGCVDRGWKNEINWIDEAEDLLDAAIAAAKASH